MSKDSESIQLFQLPCPESKLYGDQFVTCMVSSFVFKNINNSNFCFRKSVQDFNFSSESGFDCKSPTSLVSRDSLSRWLLKEPRALFKRDLKDGHSEDPEKSPRMKWITWDHNLWAKKNLNLTNVDTSEDPNLGRYQMAFLNLKECTIRFLPLGMKLEVFSLISNAGVLIVVVKISPPENSSFLVKEAMELNNLLSHSMDTEKVPVLVPPDIASSISRENKNSKISAEMVSACLKLLPQQKNKNKLIKDDYVDWGNDSKSHKIVLNSFIEGIKEDIVQALTTRYNKIRNQRKVKDDMLEVYQVSRGRTNLFTRIIFSEDIFKSLEKVQIECFESFCSQCFKHPEKERIVPIAPQTLQCKEFQTIQLTGSQRVHVSSDTTLCFGYDLSSNCSSHRLKWESDFLLSYLIAYHQSVLCQELSWSSFKKSVEGSEESRNLKELNNRFIEYCTHYDFSIISNRFDHQRMYRAQREVFGVPDISNEVAEEINSRLNTERNNLQDKFNERQEAFNSLAVLFFVFGCATFLINLNIDIFNKDAQISWDLRKGLESLWFWVPVSITLLMFFVPKIKQHFKRVFKLLFRR